MSKFIPRKDVMREMIRQDVVRKRIKKDQTEMVDCKDVSEWKCADTKQDIDDAIEILKTGGRTTQPKLI